MSLLFFTITLTGAHPYSRLRPCWRGTLMIGSSNLAKSFSNTGY